LFQHALVEAALDHVAATIFQKDHFSSVTHFGNQLALRRSHADAKNADILFLQLFQSTQRFAFMVVTVRDKNHDSIGFFFAGFKTVHCSIQGLLNRGSATGNDADVDVFKRKAEGRIINGEGAL